ncbi:MAG: DUF4339 domain-containing protein [Chlamydiae bacterium]|nr:DUF4339 domain-containing protein [Chlamydiota bacterium]
MSLPIIFIWFCFGFIASHFAKKRGRNGQIWFVIGLLFGIVGICVLFLLPSKNFSQAKKEESQPVTIDLAPEIPEELKNKFWYYLDSMNHQKGPMSFDALKRALKEGLISEKTYVWNETQDSWKPFSAFIKAKV